MIDREHPLSVVRQARLLEISRGAVYYQPRPTSESDLALMRCIDELHLEQVPIARQRASKDWIASHYTGTRPQAPGESA